MGLDIQAIIIAAVALLGSTGGVTAIFVGFLEKFKKLALKMSEMAEAKALKEALKDSHDENVALKKTMIAFMEKMQSMHMLDDDFIDKQVEDVLTEAGYGVDEVFPEYVIPETSESEEK